MYVTEDGYKLGAWLADRRAKGKDKHSKEQQRQLDELGMVWVKPDSWEVRYALAKQYYEEHGDLNISPKYKADGVWLAKWLNEQRQIYIGNRGEKSLTAEQISRLENIGMVWENRTQLAKNEAWQNQFSGVYKFYLENGHLDIPDDYLGGKGKSLSLWLSRQRSQKSSGKLSEEQIASLDELGMDWLTSAERDWENHYESAKEYYDKNGTLDIPCAYVDENGFSLGMWLWRVRSGKVKLKTSGANGNQVERLQKIGLEFSSI
jgi:hypothetical protein